MLLNLSVTFVKSLFRRYEKYIINVTDIDSL